MTPPPASIAVLGGGTAGWMTACLLARAWPQAVVTVIESPDIGIIGVGEGSTPQLKAFFDTLGIAEAEWMPRCNATYKTGIAFHGWSGRCASYFHPFPTAIDGMTAPAFFAAGMARRRGSNVCAHPDRFFLPALLAAQRKAPVAAENFPFDIGYGYHFDAHLIGAFLRGHATGKLGVQHLQRNVQGATVGPQGVTALALDGGEALTADLYIDCSGFRSMLAQEALAVKFLPFADNLFNDSAVVMPTPADPGGTNSATRATALSAGWTWDIPLTNRTGNGYVYASRYIDADAAETELRRHLGLLDGDVAARHLKMKVGRIETTWTQNILAAGLSQGFIEPLEATALHIVQATVEGFIGAYERSDRDGFNARIAARYEGIRDYIVAHYRLQLRRDTPYWRDAASHDVLSDSLKSLMTCWFTGQDLEAEIARQGIAGYYAPISWQCLFGGYGNYPEVARLRAGDDAGAMAKIDEFMARCALNFADHRAQLAGLGN